MEDKQLLDILRSLEDKINQAHFGASMAEILDIKHDSYLLGLIPKLNNHQVKVKSVNKLSDEEFKRDETDPEKLKKLTIKKGDIVAVVFLDNHTQALNNKVSINKGITTHTGGLCYVLGKINKGEKHGS